jgi:hypothetical protein
MGQILNRHMDREAFASDLADDRRDAGFFGRQQDDASALDQTRRQ